MENLQNIYRELFNIHHSILSINTRMLEWIEINKNNNFASELEDFANIYREISDIINSLKIRMYFFSEQMRGIKLPTIQRCLHCNEKEMSTSYYESGGEMNYYTLCGNCHATNGYHDTPLDAIMAHNALYQKLNPENSK